MKYQARHEDAIGNETTSEFESDTLAHAITLAIEANNKLVHDTSERTWAYALFQENGTHVWPKVDECFVCGVRCGLEADGWFEDPITGKQYVSSCVCKKCNALSKGKYERQLQEIDMKEALYEE